MITQTSLQAYNRIKEEIGERQLQVYQTLKELLYATNTMISKKIKLPINSITPRIFELRQKGLVEYSHTSWCPITKMKAKYWKCKGVVRK